MIEQRLRQLRLARGFTLDGLAAEMGGIVTKQALSKYEQGKANPTPTVLNKLAAALGVKAAHLWSEPSVTCDFIAYRKGTGLAKMEQEKVEAVVCQMLEERVRLQELTQEPARTELPIKNFTIDNIDDTERFAKQLREKWNLGLSPISTLTGTLEDHFVHVFEIEAPERFDGISAVARDSDQKAVAAAVVSRKSLPGGRQRLNLAHELAHLVLDVPPVVDEEKAAFRFAGAFLAPDECLYRDLGRKRGLVQLEELVMLKRKYRMSLQSLVYRLHDLEVISSQHAKQWWITVARQGWKKQEPFELESEQPEWLKKTLLRALSEGLMTKGDAVKMLGEPIDAHEPITLIERQAFIKLPMEERRRIMAKQAAELATHYLEEATEDLETGDFLEY
jgi:transcriptional regulator with XRE-family HTH domain